MTSWALTFSTCIYDRRGLAMYTLVTMHEEDSPVYIIELAVLDCKFAPTAFNRSDSE